MVSSNWTSRNTSGLCSSPGQPTFRCTWLNALTLPITSPVVNRAPRLTRMPREPAALVGGNEPLEIDHVVAPPSAGADVDVDDRADPEPFVQRAEPIGGHRARDDAVAHRVHQRSLLDSHVDAGMKACGPLAAAGFAERAGNLVGAVKRRDRPEKRLPAEPVGIELRRDPRRSGQAELELGSKR